MRFAATSATVRCLSVTLPLRCRAAVTQQSSRYRCSQHSGEFTDATQRSSVNFSCSVLSRLYICCLWARASSTVCPSEPWLGGDEAAPLRLGCRYSTLPRRGGGGVLTPVVRCSRPTYWYCEPALHLQNVGTPFDNVGPEADLGMFSMFGRTGAPTKRGPTRGLANSCNIGTCRK